MDLDERAYESVPWRRVPSTPYVNMAVSLSRETRSVLPTLAPTGVWLAALETVASKSRGDKRRAEVLAALHCERAVLRQLLVQDTTQPGALCPVAAWFWEEEARRKRATPVIVSARLSRDRWRLVLRRRGAMKPSEYAVHVVFEALRQAGHDPVTFVGSIDYDLLGDGGEDGR